MTSGYEPQVDEDVVLMDVEDGVATLTLNRPGSFNSASVQLLYTLTDRLF